jgi:uncharacterized protein YcbK (DUF882 family)
VGNLNRLGKLVPLALQIQHAEARSVTLYNAGVSFKGETGMALKGSAVAKLIIIFALLGVLPSFAANVGSQPDSPSYRLRLYHLHTGEHLDVVYRIGNQYEPDAIAQLDHFLRDHRTGDVKNYDLKEFDLLHDLLVRLGHPDGEIDIVCGYRTPWSNNYLRQHGHGVAEHSQHMEAKAIDIRVPGVSSAQVRDAALSLGRGGVGYYAQSDFVHVDVGRVRRW